MAAFPRSYVKMNQEVQGGAGWTQGRGRTAVVAVSSKDKLKRDPTYQKRFEKGARRNGRFPKPKEMLQSSAVERGGAPHPGARCFQWRSN